MILFLAWQDATSRQWFPIGRLTMERDGTYEFVYTRGFEDAQGRAKLLPLPAFPDVTRVYRSTALFPMFNNRIMSPAREEYAAYLARMNLTGNAAAPLSILARSLGRRSTDSFEVFPFPIDPKTAQFEIDFFVHGLRHRPEAAQALALTLAADDRLGVVRDRANVEDPAAVLVTDAAGTPLGFAPRYYAPDLSRLIEDDVTIDVSVAHVNPPPAPIQQRLLCRIRAVWPFDEPPFERHEYQPIPDAYDEVMKGGTAGVA